jgi:hypothetical protein
MRSGLDRRRRESDDKRGLLKLQLVGGHSLGLRFPIVLAQRFFRATKLLAAQLRFQGGQLCFEVSRGFAFADDLFAISSEEVVDRFDSNAVPQFCSPSRNAIDEGA